MNYTNFGSMLSSLLGSILTSNYSHVNVMMNNRRKLLAEEYINNGKEMAANTVAGALDQMTGVAATEDGYCFGWKSVKDAINAMSRGRLIMVVDNKSRENEGDFIMAADKCTAEAMAKFIRYSSGVICIGMEGRSMDKLELPPMVVNNKDPKGTAFSVSVDATREHCEQLSFPCPCMLSWPQNEK